MAALQRLQSVGGLRLAHAECHEAVVRLLQPQCLLPLRRLPLPDVNLLERLGQEQATNLDARRQRSRRIDVYDSDASSKEVLQERVEARTELLKVLVFADDAAARSPRLELDDHASNGMLSPAGDAHHH